MSKTIWICSNCNNEFGRWLGKCPRCSEFGTLKESAAKDDSKEAASAGFKNAGALTPSKKALTINELNESPIKRTATGIKELDRVLGGGFVDSEVVLFAGAPGSGKSTLSLLVASCYAKLGNKVLYSSGEESEQQIGLRAKRMGITDDLIKITNETNLETLLGHVEDEKPVLLIVDSLQTLASTQVSGSIGSVAQSREAAHTLTNLAKQRGITMILINQIIKSGEFAGSEAVQHIVDCSLILESDSDTPLKFLRANKNRFGDTTEVGVFQHSDTGIDEVSDPSGIFIESAEQVQVSGTACGFVSEGVRQIPIEIQALVSRSTLPTPRKQFSGINFQRGQIVCAILDKFCNTRLFEKDVFISTLSGMRVNDPQADLAIAASLLSSAKDKGFIERTAFVGELGLTGSVRGAFMIENKVREAERLGFDIIVIPKIAMKRLSKTKRTIKIESINSVKELVSLLPDN